MKSWGKRLLILILSTISCPAVAQQAPDNAGARFEAEEAATVAEVDTRLPSVIINWLSLHFGLPTVDDPPRIVLSTAEAMASLRHQDATSRSWPGMTSNTVALYVDADRTIYLPEGWTGTSPAELSVFVHEMVHHLQGQAGMTFACTEEREKLAYDAQQAWLVMFGRDLSSEFGIDPFSVMARSLCPI